MSAGRSAGTVEEIPNPTSHPLGKLTGGTDSTEMDRAMSLGDESGASKYLKYAEGVYKCKSFWGKREPDFKHTIKLWPSPAGGK